MRTTRPWTPRHFIAAEYVNYFEVIYKIKGTKYFAVRGPTDVWNLNKKCQAIMTNPAMKHSYQGFYAATLDEQNNLRLSSNCWSKTAVIDLCRGLNYVSNPEHEAKIALRTRKKMVKCLADHGFSPNDLVFCDCSSVVLKTAAWRIVGGGPTRAKIVPVFLFGRELRQKEAESPQHVYWRKIRKADLTALGSEYVKLESLIKDEIARLSGESW